LHLNGVLAAFVAGIVFNFAGSSDAKESQEEIQEAISRFFDLPIFVVLGIALPWDSWLELGWGGLLLVAAVLLLAPLHLRGEDVLFLGWFGPIGAVALYYAAFSYRETGIEAAWTVGSLVICASVLVHGITATPLTRAICEKVAPLSKLRHQATGFGFQGTQRRNIVASTSATHNLWVSQYGNRCRLYGRLPRSA